MSTLFVFAPAEAHNKPGHPENYGRIQSLVPFLQEKEALDGVTAVTPTPATVEQLKRVHTLSLIEKIRTVSRRGGGLLDYGDTYATADSYDLARLAAGGCCAAVDRIMTGEGASGLTVVRPPGHHAERDRVSGFCLFNNVAVAARHAQAVHGVRRVLIVDYDVHHGNGTQDIFYHDDSVLFISLHLYAPFFYPGTGRVEEIGKEAGEGYTLNTPLPPHVGDEGYGRIFREIVRPVAVGFRPELILVSAGFDAHWQDPLAAAGLSLTGYAEITRELAQMAAALCNGRILFVMEGGYRSNVLAHGLLSVLHILQGRDRVSDPFGVMPQPEQPVEELLRQLHRRHPLL